jgi:hypothetical protein
MTTTTGVASLTAPPSAYSTRSQVLAAAFPDAAKFPTAAREHDTPRVSSACQGKRSMRATCAARDPCPFLTAFPTLARSVPNARALHVAHLRRVHQPRQHLCSSRATLGVVGDVAACTSYALSRHVLTTCLVSDSSRGIRCRASSCILGVLLPLGQFVLEREQALASGSSLHSLLACWWQCLSGGERRRSPVLDTSAWRSGSGVLAGSRASSGLHNRVGTCCLASGCRFSPGGGSAGLRP